MCTNMCNNISSNTYSLPQLAHPHPAPKRWRRPATDLVCEIPSIANSPAMAPAAKCPTRIMCLIFLASGFLKCKKNRYIPFLPFRKGKPWMFLWGLHILGSAVTFEGKVWVSSTSAWIIDVLRFWTHWLSGISNLAVGRCAGIKVCISPIAPMGLVYLPTWMVDVFCKCRKINIPYMDAMGPS